MKVEWADHAKTSRASAASQRNKVGQNPRISSNEFSNNHPCQVRGPWLTWHLPLGAIRVICEIRVT